LDRPGVNESVELRKFASEDPNYTYYELFLNYSGSDWRFMDSLMVAVDGKLTRYSTSTPSRTVGNGNVLELLYFRVTQEFVDSLEFAKVVKCQYFIGPVSVPDYRVKELHDKIAVLKTLTYGSEVP